MSLILCFLILLLHTEIFKQIIPSVQCTDVNSTYLSWPLTSGFHNWFPQSLSQIANYLLSSSAGNSQPRKTEILKLVKYWSYTNKLSSNSPWFYSYQHWSIGSWKLSSWGGESVALWNISSWSILLVLDNSKLSPVLQSSLVTSCLTAVPARARGVWGPAPHEVILLTPSQVHPDSQM